MTVQFAEPNEANRFNEEYVTHLFACLKRRSQIDLVQKLGLPDIGLGRAVWEGPFFLLSQNAEKNPILNFCNKRVLEQWECAWLEITVMPSSQTASAADQVDRNLVMEKVEKQGYVTEYSGKRVSKTGKAFHIEDGIIWDLFDLMDKERRPTGRAAFFPRITVKAEMA